MRHHPDHDTASGEIEVRLEDILEYALAIGSVLVLLLPGARGSSDIVGWLPLWLLGMPAAAWWAAKGFPLPRRQAAAAMAPTLRRRRSGPQARRRIRGSALRMPARAAA